MYKRLLGGLLGGLILIFILSSCQPTPDQESVISKADDYLAVANEDTTETFSAPSEYKKEYDQNAKVLVCFDATVSYNTGPYPILRVLPRKFSETELLSICNYLQPNVPIYEETDDTKAEIMEQLTSLQTYNGDLGGFVDLSETEELQQELTERWNAASGEPTLSPYVFRKTDDMQLYPASGLTEDGFICSFMMNLGSNQFAYLRQRNTFICPASGLAPTIAVEEPVVDQANAQKAALEFVDQFGNESYALTDSEKALVVRFFSRKETAWRFVFLRKVNGIETIRQSPSVRLDTNSLPSVGAPWPPELIIIDVDSKGILSVQWTGAAIVSGVIVENSHFESFETIASRFEKQIFYQLAGQDVGVDYRFLVKCKQINLRYGLLPEKDDDSSGRYVPIWEFVYDFGFENDTEEEMNEEVMYFNAIDGSYVEPRVTNAFLMSLT